MDFTVVKRANNNISFIDNEKRFTEAPTSQSFINHNTIYRTVFVVGSNKQKITPEMDTGSRNVWVVDSNAYCQTDPGDAPNFCKANLAFNTAKSTTFKKLTTRFRTSYANHGPYTELWVTDDFAISGGPTVKDIKFGTATAQAVPMLQWAFLTLTPTKALLVC